MSEPKDSCVQPARGPILETPSEGEAQPETKEVKMATGQANLKPGPALVGKVWEVWKPEMAF